MMIKDLKDAPTERKLGLTKGELCLTQAKTCLTQAKFCPNSAKKSPNSNFRRVVVNDRQKSAEKKTLPIVVPAGVMWEDTGDGESFEAEDDNLCPEVTADHKSHDFVGVVD